jgi:hypothetical protein
LPEGRKNYTKTKPLRDAEFDECRALWDERPATEHSWRMPVAQVVVGLASANDPPACPWSAFEVQYKV